MRLSRLFKLFSPDFKSALTELPLAQLQSMGVRVLAFDLDHTLSVGWTRQLSDEHVAYLKRLRTAGFRIMIASNALTDLTALAGQLDATVVPATWKSRKPMRSYFRRLISAADCPASEIAMVGDRSFTDIFGANRCGLVSVKVTRMS